MALSSVKVPLISSWLEKTIQRRADLFSDEFLGMSTMSCADDPLGGESIVVKVRIERSLQLAGLTTNEIGGIIAHGNGFAI